MRHGTRDRRDRTVLQPPPVPTLTLDRVILRPFVADDAVSLHALLEEPDVVGAFGHDVGPTLEQVKAQLPAMIAGHTTNMAGGQVHHRHVAVEEPETGNLIGLIGLDIVGDAADVRMAIATAVRGQGYGRAALTAILDWVRDSTNLNTVTGATKPDNAAGAGVMAAAGMVETDGGAMTPEGEEVPARTFVWERAGQEVPRRTRE